MNNTALTDDDGFGLIEAVVSMLIIAALAVAFLPLLITGLKQSAANSTLAFATQLVSERMSVAHAAGPSCSALLADVPGLSTPTDPRGVRVQVVTTIAGDGGFDCTEGGDGSYTVTAIAQTVDDTGTVLADLTSASTSVLILDPTT